MSFARRWLVLMLPALSLSRAAAGPDVPSGAPPNDAALVRAVDAYVRPAVARDELSGQLLVSRHGRVLLERSYGMANRELGVPVTPETRFNIASVTKPMTGVLAIQLIEEKRIGLGDSIARWLPDFTHGDSIRVSHLLGHSSGIPHETVPDSQMTRPFTAAEVARRASALPLDFAPGAQSRYSSGGFEVLARVLELASGRTYAELLNERIFTKLGMAHSAHADSRALLPGRANAYVPGPQGIENAPLQDLSALVGAGSVWSTARDLHAFVAALRSGKLGAGAQRSYVRGGQLDFNGRTNGFKAWARWDSTSDVEIEFVGNLATGAPDDLRRDLPRLARGDSVTAFVPPALRAGAVPESEMRRWEGVYQIEQGPRLELRIRNGALYSNDWVLLATTDGRWYSPRDHGLVSGMAGAGGKIARIDWIQEGQNYPAPRTGE